MLIYMCVCPRAFEPAEPVIDQDNLEEITKHNSATLTIGPRNVMNFVKITPA